MMETNFIATSSFISTDDVPCVVCSSRGRRLRPLGVLAHAYNSIVHGLKQESEEQCWLIDADEACWECISLLGKVVKFTRLVSGAKNKNNSWDAPSRSNLCDRLKIGWDYEFKHKETDDMQPTLKTEIDDVKRNSIEDDDDLKADIKNESDDEVATNEWIEEAAIEEKKIENTKRKKRMRKLVKCHNTKKMKNKYNCLKEILNEEDMWDYRKKSMENESYANAKHKCERCLKSYVSKSILDKHFATIHAKACGEYVCDICESRFKTQSRMSVHRQSHYVVLVCTQCEYNCLHFRELLLHQSKEHPTGEIYQCNKCDQIFENILQLRQHKRTHYRAAKCTCDYCGKSMPKFNLVRHIKIHTGQPLIRCDACGQLSRGEDSHRYHVKSRHAPRPAESEDQLYCVECDVRFKTSLNLKNHLETTKRHAAHNMKISCDLCPGKFLTEWARDFHVKRYHVQKKCDICGLVLSSLYGLQTHIKRQHQNTQPEFTCHICNKTIKRKQRIEEHMRTHTGERPLSCKICGDTFRQKSALYTHTKHKHRRAQACA